VDFTLQPGTVEQSITVEADAPMLDVSTTGNATGLKEEFIHDLPVSLPSERRSITQYLYFVPGLTGGLASANDTMCTAKMDGSSQGQTEVFIDGARGTSQGIQRGAIEETGPTVDAVGEFTTVANAFDAEYGGFGAWFTQIRDASGGDQPCKTCRCLGWDENAKCATRKPRKRPALSLQRPPGTFSGTA
jgi:hypothetical protein